jgi:hypothetical protein
MTVAVFAAVVLLWLAFGAALVLRQESLDAAWTACRTAALPVTAVEGIVLLPWVAGLAIWHTPLGAAAARTADRRDRLGRRVRVRPLAQPLNNNADLGIAGMP